MTWTIPDSERIYLRGLAQKQAGYAVLPVMADRKNMWYALNDAHPGARPPVIIETWTFDRDFMPESIFHCASPVGRSIETQLLRNIRNHELIDDDKVIPDTFDIGWFVDFDEFGVKVPTERIEDAQGIETGYRYLHPIKDLERDLPLLKPASFQVDRQKTIDWQAFLTDLLGDILPVVIRTGTFGSTMLTNRVVELMGMETFFTAMYDQPDAVHHLMAYLRDNALSMMRWAEAEGLLRLNNGNQDSFGSSYNFTTRLPRTSQSDVERLTSLSPIPFPLKGEGENSGNWDNMDSSAVHIIPISGVSPNKENGSARLSDMWGCTNSQETVGVSPRMFREFCFPYYRDVCEPMGLLYYGCCEPAHPFWKEISQLPHLKKVSISRWCDQNFMGEALRGSEIVYSRKPDPNFLSVDDRLDEQAWATHIRETLAATQGVFVEFIIRDVYTVHGNLNNAHSAVEIARREIDQHYQP
jgi:hypothetical protein